MAVKFREIENVEEGDILAQNIYGSSRNILIKKNTKLTKFMINKLNQLGFSNITVKENYEDVYDENRFIDEQLVSQTIEKLRKLDADSIVDSAKQIVENAVNVKNIIFENHGIWKKSDKFFHEQLASTEFSVLVGKILDFNDTQLLDLAVAALWHKMGTLCVFDENFQKIKIPNSFRIKSTNIKEYDNALKEYDENYYPLYSVGLIADNNNISSTAKMAIALHRENISFAYENGKINKNVKNLFTINLNEKENAYIFSRILHITDSFQDIKYSKINGRFLSTDEALEYIYVVDNKIDENIVNAVRDAINPNIVIKK